MNVAMEPWICLSQEMIPEAAQASSRCPNRVDACSTSLVLLPLQAMDEGAYRGRRVWERLYAAISSSCLIDKKHRQVACATT